MNKKQRGLVERFAREFVEAADKPPRGSAHFLVTSDGKPPRANERYFAETGEVSYENCPLDLGVTTRERAEAEVRDVLPGQKLALWRMEEKPVKVAALGGARRR